MLFCFDFQAQTLLLIFKKLLCSTSKYFSITFFYPPLSFRCFSLSLSLFDVLCSFFTNVWLPIPTFFTPLALAAKFKQRKTEGATTFCSWQHVLAPAFWTRALSVHFRELFFLLVHSLNNGSYLKSTRSGFFLLVCQTPRNRVNIVERAHKKKFKPHFENSLKHVLRQSIKLHMIVLNTKNFFFTGQRKTDP